jgi:L-seryl-tRNA(Ser) seleniumtransferase
MTPSLFGELRMANTTTRRNWIKSSGAGSTAALLAAAGAQPMTAATPKEPPPDVYTRIGVKPFINCTATITRNGGSRLLPEVIEAVEHAAHYHVSLNLLIEAASKRISELLQVPWAAVCSGAAAGLAHATSACIAGANPEWRHRLPNLSGMKNEVIMPKWSRNQYDHSIRMVGARIVEVETVAELRAALSPHTAMVALLGDRFGNDRPNLEDLAPIARERGIPILVDAAADYPVVPNPYLKAGADLVVYSGGKILRGPQSSGILLGREDLVRTASLHAAPNGGFGRPMKVSKEELVGIVTAVEVWVKQRDIHREYEEWKGWYDHISREARQVDGVATRVQGPTRGGPFPTLRVSWDREKIGLSASDMHERLMAHDPAIMTWNYGEENFFVIRPVALKPEEYKTVAKAVRSILAAAPRGGARPAPSAPAGDISGQWDVEIEFLRGRGKHRLFLDARASTVVGTHIGTRTTGELTGTIDGSKVSLNSILPMEGSRLRYGFTGVLQGDTMQGDLDLNEYPPARWVAQRRRTA